MHFVIYCNLYFDHADRKWVFTARNSGDFNAEEQTSKLTEIQLERGENEAWFRFKNM